MGLQKLHTLSRNKPFEYKYADGEEIIVYPSDNEGASQRQHALVITHFEQKLVRDTIKSCGSITIGATRDHPPDGSLGATLKDHGCSPQILSYLPAILVTEKFCMPSKNGNVLALTFNSTAAP
jgi:hypothetical protein